MLLQALLLKAFSPGPMLLVSMHPIVLARYGWDGWVAGEGEDRGPCAPRDRRSQQAGGGNNMSPSTPTRRPPAKGDPTWSQSSSDTSQSGHHL